MTQKFKRKTIFLPAFDKRHADPKKNYGIHGVTCKMYLIGERGVVQFVFYTDWQLPHVRDEFLHSPHGIRYPMATDIGYHSPIPMYEDQVKRDCSFIKDGCYYDGSSLYAEEFLTLLIEKGSKAVWKKMKEYYRGVFEKPNDEKTWNDAGFGQIINAMFGCCEEKPNE
jgi:hypothetical protein